MRRLIALSSAFFTVTFLHQAHAQNAVAVCLAMVTEAARNVGLQTSNTSFLNTIFNNYCEQNGSVKTSSSNVGFSALAGGIPIGLTGGSSDAQAQQRNFCSNYASTFASSSESTSFQSIVVEKALQSANQCLAIAEKAQAPISYSILTPQRMAITFGIPSGQSLNIRGIDHESTVKCVGSKIDGGGTIEYAAGVGQTMTAAAGSHAVSCTREPIASSGGTAQYNATSLLVDTNFGHLNIFWPQETVLPLTSASQLQALISSLESQISGIKTNVDFNMLPIGTLVAWNSKSDPPRGWIKCDGSDARCPNLVDRFLRGSASAGVGALKGQEGSVRRISQHGSDNRIRHGNGWSIDGDHYLSTDVVEIDVAPPSVGVVFIMKASNS
ncbi:MAG: hypothetical protein AB7H90_08590 [Alphaproteobacteria bacterium]